MNKWEELNYWNNRTYGKSFKISKYKIKSFLIGLGVAVPVIIPLPLMMLIAWFVKKDINVRYE